MSVVRKLPCLCSMLLACVLLTGFFGGEKPADALQALIKAIESNNSAGFYERVPSEFWSKLDTAKGSANKGSSNIASIHDKQAQLLALFGEALLQSLAGDASTRKALEKSLRGNSPASGAEYARDLSLDSIESGDFANMCRMAKLPLRMFAPELLQKAQISEEGKGAEAGTASATMTLPDGQVGVLGLVEVGKKWMVASWAGNAKAAVEQAVPLRQKLLDASKKREERRKNSERYIKEIKLLVQKKQALHEAKDMAGLTALFAKPLDCDLDEIHVSVAKNLPLDAPEVWQAVTTGIALCMQKPDDKKRIETRAKNFLQEKFDASEFDFTLGEVLFLSGDTMLLRIEYPTALKEDAHGTLKLSPQIHEKWLQGFYDQQPMESAYLLFKKQDGVWKYVASSSVEHRQQRKNQYELYEHYELFSSYALMGESTLSFSPEAYMLELAKRFDGLVQDARALVKHEQAWKDSCGKALTSLQNAVSSKNADAFSKLVALPNVLRDTGPVTQVAAATLDNKDSNADVSALLQQIGSGQLAPESPFHAEALGKAEIRNIQEKRAVVHTGAHWLLFERESTSAPWILTRYDDSAGKLSRPADWQAKVAKEIEALQVAREAQRKAQQAEQEAQRKAQQEEQERLAAEREAQRKAQQEDQERMNKELAAVAGALADGLDAKNPDAVLSVLSADTLALCPALQCNDTDALKWKVAPTAAYTRTLRAAIAEGKAPSALKHLWDTAALRKARFAFIPEHYERSSRPIMGTITIAQGEFALLFAKSGATYHLITAPLPAKEFSLPALTALLDAWDKTLGYFTPTPDQIFMQTLAQLLRDKNAEAAMAYLDVAALYYWNPNDSYSSAEAMTKATLLPEMQAEKRQPLMDSILKTGSCIVKGTTLDGDSIENALISHDNNMLLLHTTPHGLIFVDKKAVAVDTQLDTHTRSSLVRNFYSLQKDIASRKDSVLKKAAITSCLADLMDRVQASNVTCRVEQSKDSSRELVVYLQADISSQLSLPAKLETLELLILDEKDILQTRYSLRNDPIQLSKGRSVRQAWRFSIDKKGFYMMEQAHKGKAKILLRAYEMRIADTTYKRDSEYNVKVQQKEDGMWQMGNFPPVRLTNQEMLLPSQEEKKALEQALQQREAEQAEKSLAAVNALLGKVQVQYNAGRSELTFLNSLPQEARIERIRLDIMEGNTVLHSQTPSINTQLPAGEKHITKVKNLKLAAKQRAEIAVTELFYGGVTLKENSPCTMSGVMPPLLYQDNPVLFSLAGNTPPATTQPKAEPKAETPVPAKAESKAESKAEAKTEAKAEPKTEPKTEAKAEAKAEPKAETSTPAKAGTVTAKASPSTTEGKKNGTAVLADSTFDLVGLQSFAPDGKPDSALRVSVQGQSPVVGIRTDNVGGTLASWKTSGVKTSANGVLAVLKDGVVLNAADAPFSIDVSAAVTLDLLMQDSGAIADEKTKLRVVFFHKDGTRSYALLTRDK